MYEFLPLARALKAPPEMEAVRGRYSVKNVCTEMQLFENGMEVGVLVCSLLSFPFFSPASACSRFHRSLVGGFHRRLPHPIMYDIHAEEGPQKANAAVFTRPVNELAGFIRRVTPPNT
uniref:Uncharacterized protein n=1 Tax=Panagrellus redivivus TaxID=6233 RepID=A0A7E4W6A1_PANRE